MMIHLLGLVQCLRNLKNLFLNFINMPEDMITKLQTRKEAVTKEFDQLKANKENLIKQGKELQRKLNDIEARLVELRGAYAELELLLKPDKKESPKKEEKK